jgi:hypothetical protein
MDENEQSRFDDAATHPLIVTYPKWLGGRWARQTKTTMAHLDDAHKKRDVELLKTYHRLLGDKNGAWIKHVVKAVRKKPELGTVADITAAQVDAYAAVRAAANKVLYGNTPGKKYDKGTDRDRTNEYELFDFAIASPDKIPVVCEIMVERSLLDLTSILEVSAYLDMTHSAISEGVL